MPLLVASVDVLDDDDDDDDDNTQHNSEQYNLGDPCAAASDQAHTMAATQRQAALPVQVRPATEADIPTLIKFVRQSDTARGCFACFVAC